MANLKRLVMVALVGGGAGSCSDSTEPTLPNIVGNGLASKAELIRVANPATKVDLVAQGAVVTVSFTATTFTLSATIPGEPASVSTGTYVQTASSVTFTETNPGSDVTTFGLSLSGSTLLLTGGTGFEMDFGNGNEAATLDLTLVKQ